MSLILRTHAISVGNAISGLIMPEDRQNQKAYAYKTDPWAVVDLSAISKEIIYIQGLEFQLIARGSHTRNKFLKRPRYVSFSTRDDDGDEAAGNYHIYESASSSSLIHFYILSSWPVILSAGRSYTIATQSLDVIYIYMTHMCIFNMRSNDERPSVCNVDGVNFCSC